MDWNRIVVKKIHSVFNIQVERGKGGLVNRRLSGLVFAPCGEVVYRMNGEEYVLNGTNIMYLPSGGNYIFESKWTGICPQINFECDYDKCEFISFPVKDLSVYAQKFEKIREIFYHDNSSYSHHASLSALYDIIASIDRDIATTDEGTYSHRAEKYMSDHLESVGISCDDIASFLNISTVYFRKVFFEDKGMPPMSYLRKMRMDKAKDLLKIPGKAVGDIALEVGYSGIYPFSRVFKREVGMTPTEYASRYKNAY